MKTIGAKFKVKAIWKSFEWVFIFALCDLTNDQSFVLFHVVNNETISEPMVRSH